MTYLSPPSPQPSPTRGEGVFIFGLLYKIMPKESAY